MTKQQFNSFIFGSMALAISMSFVPLADCHAGAATAYAAMDDSYADLFRGTYDSYAPKSVAPLTESFMDSSLTSLTKAYLDLPMVDIVEDTPSTPLTNTDRLEFAKLAYDADKADQNVFNEKVAALEADGWTVEKLTGSTGSATEQVESTMGVIAYRGKQAMIATRGTTGADDWKTNFRAARNVGQEIMGLFFPSYNAESDQIAAQFLKANGKVHNGFLQTHLSTWDQIKASLLARAKTLGVAVADLNIETTGHSLGAGQQDLNQFHLLTDSDLGLGRQKVGNSLLASTGDLDMSAFYAPALSESIVNTGVRGTAFESPNAFGTTAAQDFDRKVGKGNSPHVHNFGDAVPSLPPVAAGYSPVGDAVPIDAGANDPLTAHVLTGMGDEAVKALDQIDAGKTVKTSKKAALKKRVKAARKSVARTTKKAASAIAKPFKRFGVAWRSNFGW